MLASCHTTSQNATAPARRSTPCGVMGALLLSPATPTLG
jgi:hypothetical protein